MIDPLNILRPLQIAGQFKFCSIKQQGLFCLIMGSNTINNWIQLIFQQNMYSSWNLWIILQSPFIVCVQNLNHRTWHILNQWIWNRGHWSKFCWFLPTACFIEICYAAKSIVSGLVLINRQLCALVQPRCGHHHQQPRLWQYWLWSFQLGNKVTTNFWLCLSKVFQSNDDRL